MQMFGHSWTNYTFVQFSEEVNATSVVNITFEQTF